MIALEHIDAIGRAKKRDVLFIVFSELGNGQPKKKRYAGSIGKPRFPVRTQITKWLDGKNIPWLPCADVANVDQLKAYEGQIYIDLPCDDSLPDFRALNAYLETPDGKSRFKGVQLCCCPLDLSMENAHHDSPGFWGQWAENF